MNLYLHDGTAFDLDAVFVDVTGVEWVHTGEWSAGEPLLVAPGREPVPLPTVYRDRGPLLSRPGPVPAALRRAVLIGGAVTS